MSVHATRRLGLRAFAALAGSASPWLAGCDLVGAPRHSREPAMYEVLAPHVTGRHERFEAWGNRYAGETGVRLVGADPATRFRSGGDAAAARQLAEEHAAGGRNGIVWLPHEALQDLARQRALRPLSELVRRDRIDLKPFMPCALQPCYDLEGRLSSLPDQVDAGQLYFNRRHLLDAGIDFRRAGLDFERPDSRWDTLRRAVLDLSFLRREQLPWHPGSAPLDVWAWANGGAWLDDAGRLATFTRPQNVEALEWLASAAQEAGGTRLPPAEQLPPVAQIGSDSDPIGGHPFLDGRLSLWFDSGRFMSTVVWARPDFPIGYVESPRRQVGSPLVTWARSSGYALTAAAPDALWPALRFLVSEDAAIVDAAARAAEAPLAPSGKPRWYPPFTGQLRADKFLLSRYRIESKILDEGRDHALEQLRHARPRERSLAAEALWPLVRQAQIAALRGTPARAALEDAQRRAQAILDERYRGSR